MENLDTPQRTTRRYTIDLDLTLRRRLRIAAIEDDLVLADVVRELLEQWLRDRVASVPPAQGPSPRQAHQPVASKTSVPPWTRPLESRAARSIEIEASRPQRTGLPTVPPARC